LTWNYWFNDAVSTAADLVALQLVLQYWSDNFPGWAFSLIFWAVLIALNLFAVHVYGEVEYWMSVLKVITIIVFIILGIAVNCGGNESGHYIGGENWHIPGAPFVGGIGGFASVFVTAAFACMTIYPHANLSSTHNIQMEEPNPSPLQQAKPKTPRAQSQKSFSMSFGVSSSSSTSHNPSLSNIPLTTYSILSSLIIGLNIPYNYPDLTSKDVKTSPFTLVFEMTGTRAAGSVMNAVIMTSVLSAGNHALFAGVRLLYTLAIQGHAPSFFGKLNRNQVPWVAVLTTGIVSGLCFGSSKIGAGQLWTWLQKYVSSLSMPSSTRP
jgi:AAT family amino acid transporter